jgi:hypothetical protein
LFSEFRVRQNKSLTQVRRGTEGGVAHWPWNLCSHDYCWNYLQLSGKELFWLLFSSTTFFDPCQ